jgi:hypothetical protein
MIATVEECQVGTKDEGPTPRGGKRPGAGRPKSERDDVTVKMDRGLVARARFVAEIRGVTLAEYLSEAVRPVVDRDFGKAAKPTGQG